MPIQHKGGISQVKGLNEILLWDEKVYDILNYEGYVIAILIRDYFTVLDVLAHPESLTGN